MPAASCSMTAASMSMIDQIGSLLRTKLARLRGPSRDPARGDGAIVPKDSIAGNSLAAVVAIMTFLAAVTSGAVAMVISSATECTGRPGLTVSTNGTLASSASGTKSVAGS